MNEDKYPSKAVIVLDMLSAAISIDECFGQFLVPPAPGAYLPGRMEPTLKEMTAYYLYTDAPSESWKMNYGLYQPRYSPHGAMRTNHERSGEFKVNNIKQMQEKVSWQQALKMRRGVVDAEGAVVVANHLVDRLSETPTVPVTALWIVRELIEEWVRQFQVWEPHGADNSNEIVAKYLVKTGPWQGEVDLDNNLNLYQAWREQRSGDLFNKDDVIEDVIRQVRTLRSQIASFIGDDEWKVHFFRYHSARAVSLVKSEDFRIIVYNEKKASGEW